ncbi:hypothetical protein FACS1894190_08220 [Spirochaetia bacterium]|nr:hypothetical protein FACS1894190_08220 [Spirochaetia bacterium]
MIQGGDFLLRLITEKFDVDIPFSGKTLREKLNVMRETAAIEGVGLCGAVVEKCGTTGGVTTLLTISNAPALFAVMFGKYTGYEFVSETLNLYKHFIQLVPLHKSPRFELVEKYCSHQNTFLSCIVKSFELRFHCDETIKVHLDIDGDVKTQTIPIINEIVKRERTEYFSEIGTSYKVDDVNRNSIYGLVVRCDKTNGTKTEIAIHRYLQDEFSFPAVIENFTITSRLFRDGYETYHHGLFSLTFTNHKLINDNTEVCTADTVIGPLRYLVCGNTQATVYNESTEALL